jgi:hypothetical protein
MLVYMHLCQILERRGQIQCTNNSLDLYSCRVLGVKKKTVGVPEHKIYEVQCAIHERQGDKESPKVCTRLKSCEPLYTCPCAPFYRETNGLLHSDNTLESREYSQCEHAHERLLHPVIYGANFVYLQAWH